VLAFPRVFTWHSWGPRNATVSIQPAFLPGFGLGSLQNSRSVLNVAIVSHLRSVGTQHVDVDGREVRTTKMVTTHWHDHA
jgi:hypothetical protein